MGLGDIVDKAKEWAGKNPDKADQGVDKGTEAIKGRFAGHEEQIDSASGKAKDFLHGQDAGAPGAQGEPPQSPPQGEQPPQQ